MENDRNGHEQRHLAGSELLPWYVNGTLGVAERAAVETHLAECAECREQADFWRRLAAQVAGAGDSPAPHPAQFRRLLERLDEAPDSIAASSPSGGWSGSSRRWRWAVVAQAVALVALLAALLVSSTRPRREAGFRTLADAPPAAAGLRLRVVFDESTTERELRELLVPLGAAIVGGPSPLGVYTLELPSGAVADEAAAALRARPAVRFAEPVMAAAVAPP